MEGQVTLLGVTIELANADEAFDRTMEYLEDKQRHIIRFVDMKACTLASESTEQAEQIAACDYILPADYGTEQGIRQLNKNYRSLFWHKDYFDRLFRYASDHAFELFFVTEKTEEYEELIDAILTDFPYLSMHGKALGELDENTSYDLIANDINIVAPDILFFYVDIDKQNVLQDALESIVNASLFVYGNGILNVTVEEIKAAEEQEKEPALNEKVEQQLTGFIKGIHTTIKRAIFANRVKNSQPKGKEEEEENR